MAGAEVDVVEDDVVDNGFDMLPLPLLTAVGSAGSAALRLATTSAVDMTAFCPLRDRPKRTAPWRGFL